MSDLQKTKEKINDLWSKTLQGKVNNNINTSNRTLSVLNHITSDEANMLKKAVKYQINDYILFPYSNKMSIDFPNHWELLRLSDANLIESARLHMETNLMHDRKRNISQLGEYNGHWLYVTPILERERLLPCVFLTEAGQELARLVTHEPDRTYLSYISKHFKKTNQQLKMTKLGRLHSGGFFGTRKIFIEMSDEFNVD